MDAKETTLSATEQVMRAVAVSPASYRSVAIDFASQADELREALGSLFDAVPSQTEDNPWWHDDLTHAMAKAQKLVDIRVAERAGTGEPPLQTVFRDGVEMPDGSFHFDGEPVPDPAPAEGTRDAELEFALGLLAQWFGVKEAVSPHDRDSDLRQAHKILSRRVAPAGGEDRWIAVEHELPPEDCSVIAAFSTEQVFEVERIGNEYENAAGSRRRDATHWRRLPSPPAAQEKK